MTSYESSAVSAARADDVDAMMMPAKIRRVGDDAPAVIFEASDEFYCILNRQAEIELISDNVEAHSGHKSDELLGQSVFQLITNAYPPLGGQSSSFDQSRFIQILNSLPTDPTTKQTDFDKSYFTHTFNCDVYVKDRGKETYVVTTTSILYHKTIDGKPPSWCLLILFRKGIFDRKHNLLDTLTVEQFCTLIDSGLDYRIVEVDTSCSVHAASILINTRLAPFKPFISCVHELDQQKVIEHFEVVRSNPSMIHKADYRLETANTNSLYVQMSSRYRESTNQILSSHTLIRPESTGVVRKRKSPNSLVPLSSMPYRSAPPVTSTCTLTKNNTSAQDRDIMMANISHKLTIQSFKDLFESKDSIGPKSLICVNTSAQESARRDSIKRPFPKVALPDMDDGLIKEIANTQTSSRSVRSSREIRDYVFKRLELKFGKGSIASAREERKFRAKASSSLISKTHQVQAVKRPSPSQDHKMENKLRRFNSSLVLGEHDQSQAMTSLPVSSTMFMRPLLSHHFQRPPPHLHQAAPVVVTQMMYGANMRMTGGTPLIRTQPCRQQLMQMASQATQASGIEHIQRPYQYPIMVQRPQQMQCLDPYQQRLPVMRTNGMYPPNQQQQYIQNPRMLQPGPVNPQYMMTGTSSVGANPSMAPQAYVHTGASSVRPMMVQQQQQTQQPVIGQPPHQNQQQYYMPGSVTMHHPQMMPPPAQQMQQQWSSQNQQQQPRIQQGHLQQHQHLLHPQQQAAATQWHHQQRYLQHHHQHLGTSMQPVPPPPPQHRGLQQSQVAHHQQQQSMYQNPPQSVYAPQATPNQQPPPSAGGHNVYQ